MKNCYMFCVCNI